MAKSRSLPFFVNKFYGDTATPILVYIVYGCFSAPMAKLIVVAEWKDLLFKVLRKNFADFYQKKGING